MKNNTYKEEFSNYMQIMNEALDKEDFRTYGTVRMMLDEAVEERKNDKALEDELNTSNFGILNHIFEQRLPELFKKDKKAVRDVIKTIKEDNNLLSQFNYYNSIRNYHGSITGVLKPEGMVQRLNETVLPSIDRETLAKSNKKFRKTLEEHRIVPNEMISEEMRRLYESGHNILSKNHGNVANLGVIAESTKNICDYLEKHKNDTVTESVEPSKLIKDFEEKLKETLTESEISFVQQITDWRTPMAEQRKEKLFNKFKNECIDKIDEMLKEDTDNEELKTLRKQIEEQKFNNSSIVKDIAKMLEIRDILLEK